MAKKKPLAERARPLRKPEPALSSLGIGSLVRIVLLAAMGIAGAVMAIWIHYRKPALPAPAPSASDGIEYIDIDLSSDAAVLELRD